MTGYVLVSYTESGTVTAYSTGVIRGGSLLLGNPGPPANFLISAGQANFGQGNFSVSFTDETASLFVSADPRDAYLSAHRSPDKCTVLVGFQQQFYVSAISIDKGNRLPLPSGWVGYPQGSGELTAVQWLAPLQVAPGVHRIEIPRKSLTSEASTEFTCDAGDLRFATIGAKPNEQLSSGLIVEMDAFISVSGEMPEPFRNQPLLIWQDGNWLVPMEPAQ